MDRPFPYCERIDFELLTMLGSGHLYWETNRAGSVYKADDRMFKHFETKVRNKFRQNELVKLGEIAEKLAA